MLKLIASFLKIINVKIQVIFILPKFDTRKETKCEITSQFIESNGPLVIKQEVGLFMYYGDMIINYYNM